MGHKRFSPNGKSYNEQDPLGVIAHENEIEYRLTEPNPIQKFLETEAIRKDEARKLRIEQRPSYNQLRQEFKEIIHKLIGMVITTETSKGYKKGRIIAISNGMVHIETRGDKKKMWVDFDEVLKLTQNYE